MWAGWIASGPASDKPKCFTLPRARTFPPFGFSPAANNFLLLDQGSAAAARDAAILLATSFGSVPIDDRACVVAMLEPADLAVSSPPPNQATIEQLRLLALVGTQ